MSLLGFTVLKVVDFEALDDGYDLDDQFQANAEEASGFLLIGMIVAGVSIIFCGIGIYGAVKYNQCMVICVGLWYCGMTIYNCIAVDWIGIILTALFSYPHFALFHEMKKGVITPDNYINEKHSCCCMHDATQ